MLAANEVDLRQRVEDRPGGLAHELQGTADVERTIEHLFRPREIADPHANLAEGGQRDAQAVGGARLLLQLDAALGERERLLVPVQHHRDIGLVAADGRQDVARFDRHGQPLGVPQRRHGLVQPPFLRERDPGERMDHREVPPVAGRVEGRSRLGDVLADDGDVADLTVAEAELVVAEANGARIVGPLGLLESLGQQGDASRRFAAGDGEPAVHSPEVGEPGGIEPLAPLGRRSERLGRLPHVVLEQPGLGEGAPQLDLVVAPEAGLLQRARQQRGGVRAMAAFERLHGLRVGV